MLYSLHTPKEI